MTIAQVSLVLIIAVFLLVCSAIGYAFWMSQVSEKVNPTIGEIDDEH